MFVRHCCVTPDVIFFVCVVRRNESLLQAIEGRNPDYELVSGEQPEL